MKRISSFVALLVSAMLLSVSAKTSNGGAFHHIEAAAYTTLEKPTPVHHKTELLVPANYNCTPLRMEDFPPVEQPSGVSDLCYNYYIIDHWSAMIDYILCTSDARDITCPTKPNPEMCKCIEYSNCYNQLMYAENEALAMMWYCETKSN